MPSVISFLLQGFAGPVVVVVAGSSNESPCQSHSDLQKAHSHADFLAGNTGQQGRCTKLLSQPLRSPDVLRAKVPPFVGD